MHKKIISAILFLPLLNSSVTWAKEISLEEIAGILSNSTLNSKRSELNIEEKKALARNSWDYLIPEVSLFGGVKSHENEIELKKKHFLGIRSSYTLFDGGEKRAGFKLSQLNLNSSVNELNIVFKKDEIALLNILVKEKAILEKLDFFNAQSKKFEDLNNRANEKVRAGVLSSVESFSVSLKVKELENLKLELIEELEIVKLEKNKVLNLVNKENEGLVLRETLSEIVNKLKSNLYLNSLEESLVTKNYLELEKLKIKNDLDSNYLKPVVSLFAEKGLTRTIEGEFLESDESNRLSFGIEFELPLFHESGQNFKEVYAAKTRQKILELERQSLEHNISINKKINKEKIQIKEKALTRQVEFNKLKQNELAMFKKSINSGLIEYPDYVEAFIDWVEVSLEEVEKKEELIQAILSYSSTDAAIKLESKALSAPH